MLACESSYVTANVKGSGASHYPVSLEWQASYRAIVAFCACPHFDSGELCKHIWATLLEAETHAWGKDFGPQGEVLHGLLDTDLSAIVDDEDDEDEWQTFQRHQTDVYYPAPPRVRKPGDWRFALETVRHDPKAERHTDNNDSVPARTAWYAINLNASEHSGSLVIDYYHRQRLRTGEFGKVKRQGVNHQDIKHFEDPVDRHLLALLIGNTPKDDLAYRYEYSPRQHGCHLSPVMYALVLPDLCATKRLVAAGGAALDEDALQPISWDPKKLWRLQLDLSVDDKNQRWNLTGWLKSTGDHISLDTPQLVLDDGLVLHAGQLSGLEASVEEFSWITGLRNDPLVYIPYADRDAFLESWWAAPYRPEVDLPASLNLPTNCPLPQAIFSVLREAPHERQWRYANVGFRYDNHVINVEDPRFGVVASDHITVRDWPVEKQKLQQLAALGVNRNAGHYFHEMGGFHVGRAKVNAAVVALAESGWTVEIEKVRVRIPGALNLKVDSAIDWFGLSGELDFDGAGIDLPTLLRAIRRGDSYVLLADGSKGLLPSEWLRENNILQFASVEGDQVRFKPSQTLLLDAILAKLPEKVPVDAKFARWRTKLQSLSGVKPRSAPRGFCGALRPYQEDGLGWLRFLHEFELGGCLADDMGLGKTVQVLALLESTRKTSVDPAIVVVPRSLVFNWVAEARRFTPLLRVLEYIGNGRAQLRTRFAAHDLIITTYGTLRRDIDHLKDIHFEYVILDEAQAIKNAASVTAKACRVLNATHRLAMSGTPIENHLGEIWSLFEFLNPGLLGSAKMFADLSKERDDNKSILESLAAGLRPYILRRTKAQVAADLPAKTEQTIYCELEGAQRAQYDELRTYYAASLNRQVSSMGLKRSKIQVLEALLRLRQAACHPGLIDINRCNDGSAKLTALTDQILEVLDGGHKALVFSQFTQFLALVRNDLDAKNINYEYLDGHTRNRETIVTKFQEDPNSKLFLISLKAGGHGLNLTAADYVFLLDPWWNPAVEAQAVARAHRIGQTRPVFAYRLIARDTVEEKILVLQEKKLALAESIIREDQNILRTLTSEDLSLLLS